MYFLEIISDNQAYMCDNDEKLQRLEEFKNQFSDADAKKLNILDGLIEEAFDCKEELKELKDQIAELKSKGARFPVIARREKVLIQKRASYTNMMSKLCRELCIDKPAAENYDDLEEYE